MKEPSCTSMQTFSSIIIGNTGPQVLLITRTTHNNPSLILQSSFSSVCFIKGYTESIFTCMLQASAIYFSVPLSRTELGLRGPLFLNIELFNALVLDLVQHHSEQH